MFCFVLVINAKWRPFGHLSALILTTFETKGMNPCVYAYIGEKFRISAQIFQAIKTTKIGTFEGVFVYGYSSDGTV